jgi:N4-gp56 family major capsid protein
MQNWYDRLFIDTAKHTLIHEQGAQMRPLPAGEGKVVYFQRYTPLTIITAQTAEGSNPSAVNLSATNVSSTVSEFGSYTSISKLLKLTAVDSKMKGAVEVMGQNAGESRDQLVRDHALVAKGTEQLGGGASALTDVAITDTLSSTELRKAVRTLKANKAMRYKDGYFLAKTGPYSSYDMQGDTKWVNAHTYKDGEELYRGEIGKIYGVRVIETTNPKETANGGASNADIQHTFVHAKNSFGVTDLEGDSKHVYVKTPGPNSTDNPVDRFYTVGWAMSSVPVRLVSEWIIEIKHGATGKT